MTEALEQAISVAARLPDKEQEFIAAKIKEAIDRIADSAEWDVQFANSSDVLEALYDEGMAEYKAGRTITIAS